MRITDKQLKLMLYGVIYTTKGQSGTNLVITLKNTEFVRIYWLDNRNEFIFYYPQAEYNQSVKSYRINDAIDIIQFINYDDIEIKFNKEYE